MSSEEKKSAGPGRGIAGVPISLNGVQYIVPALNLKALKRFAKEIEGMSSDQTTNLDKLALVGEIALVALRRNYPDLNAEFVEDALDMSNCFPVFAAIIGQSGYTAEGKSTGEAAASQ